MKVLMSVANGAVQLVEDGGVVSLTVDKDLVIGGGAAAGMLEVDGKGSVKFDANTGIKLGEALLNAHLPASVQALAAVVEGIANQAIKTIE
jgi:hypothetical protein